MSEKKGNFRLGEKISGVKYFGQEKVINRRNTAIFICPICDKPWRVAIYSIKNKNIKSCCGNGKKKKQKVGK